MAVSRTFQFDGVAEVARDLERDAEVVIPKVKATTSKALLNMKRGAQQRVSGHKHLTQLGRSYSYDVWVTGSKVTGEVGAVLERGQGGLDGLIEYGTPTSAPLPHWAPEAEREVPVWTRYIEQALLEGLS